MLIVCLYVILKYSQLQFLKSCKILHVGKISIFNSLIYSGNSNSYFFLLSSSSSVIFFKLCFQHVTHVTNDANVTNVTYGYVRVTGVHGYEWVWVVAHGCARVGVCGCICDEFSEYLLETRFLTSANYNTHPLRIFYTAVVWRTSWQKKK